MLRTGERGRGSDVKRDKEEDIRSKAEMRLDKGLWLKV